MCDFEFPIIDMLEAISYTVCFVPLERDALISIDLSLHRFRLITEIFFSGDGETETSPEKMENQIAPYTYSGSSGGVYNSSRNVMQQRQDMVNREALCYTRLHEASLEAEVLRLENTELRSMNRHLKTELNQLIRSSTQNRFDYDRIPLRMLSNLSIGGNHDTDEVENQNPKANRDDVSDESPTSVMGNDEDQNRSSLPKSISVRSSGYSKTSQGGGGVAQCGKSRGAMAIPKTCGPGQLSTKVKLTNSFFVFLITVNCFLEILVLVESIIGDDLV